MTSKCGKNKKVAHEAIAECVTDVLTDVTFSSERSHIILRVLIREDLDV